jgi:hypothetical protein
LESEPSAARAAAVPFRSGVLPVPELLLANGETLERHVFTDRELPVGVEVLERCTS